MTENVYAHVSPNALAAYLESRGWSRVETAERVAIWRSEDTDILAPLTSDLSDYDDIVASAVSKLATALHTKASQIAQDLMAVAYDIIELKQIIGMDELATIPLQSAAEAIQSLQRLALGVAYSSATERQPRAVVPSKRPADVTEFMGSIKFGQLRNGSTAYAMFAPVPLVGQMSFWDEANRAYMPFARKVMAHVPDAVRAAAMAVVEARTGKGVQAFADGIERGVTVPLLRAMRQLIRILPESTPLEVVYSPLLRGEENVKRVPLISLEADDVLAEGIAFLESREPAEVDEIQGQVVSLGREPEDVQGAISMVAFLNRKAQRVYVRLAEEDYQAALLAHGKRVNVEVRGRLRREGRRLWLDEPHDFRIVSEDETMLELPE